MSAVVFEKVGFFYPDSERAVLRDVDLTIPQGCFALVTGRTGAGKSTLLRAMNGLVPHFTGGRFTGRVLVAGRSTTENAPRDLADVVAFVPQDPGASFVVDRVEDELAYAMENLGVDRQRMRRRVEEVLDLLALEPLRRRNVRDLSGGERQRVAIAAALTAGPRILVLDEPTSQLDPQGAEDVLAALQRLVHDAGMTVVIAEHRLERVASFADVAIGCRLGAPVVMGDPARVFESVGTGPPVARLGVILGWEPTPLTVRSARNQAPSLSPPPPQTRRPHPDDVLLRAEKLDAGYRDRTVLRHVDLELARGEIVCLMGRNGSGKTTLLRCLVGLHEPEKGRVSTALGERPRPGTDVAFCPQTPEDILFKETVLDEIETTVRAARSDLVPGALLQELDIAGLADSHPRDLSAGQRFLVAIGAIAATDAEVLLLDEPTRGLDPEAKRVLVFFLRTRAEAGDAIMLATHDVELAAEIATRVVMLAGGEVIADGSPDAVMGDSPVFAPQMARVFGPGWLTVDQVIAEIDARAEHLDESQVAPQAIT